MAALIVVMIIYKFAVVKYVLKLYQKIKKLYHEYVRISRAVCKSK